MGFFEDMFDEDMMFDSDYKQRKDIRNLQEQLGHGANTALTKNAQLAARVQKLEGSIDRLQLVVNAFADLIERKGLATRDELEVLIQQADLLDGVEDGKMREVWAEAPTCRSCGHYINPQREVCIYCSEIIPRTDVSDGSPYRGGAPEAAAAAPEIRLAACAKCKARVPQADTYFTDEGVLVCSDCHSAR